MTRRPHSFEIEQVSEHDLRAELFQRFRPFVVLMDEGTDTLSGFAQLFNCEPPGWSGRPRLSGWAVCGYK